MSTSKAVLMRIQCGCCTWERNVKVVSGYKDWKAIDGQRKKVKKMGKGRRYAKCPPNVGKYDAVIKCTECPNHMAIAVGDSSKEGLMKAKVDGGEIIMAFVPMA